MRKIVSLMHMSLDGLVAGPNGELDWINIQEEIFDYVEGFIRQADTGLYGPHTFGMMEAHWPGVLLKTGLTSHQMNHARWYSASAKIVLSRRLKKLENEQAILITEDLTTKIQALKRQDGKNIILFGSPGVVQSLLGLRLIDEFVITLNPVILGQGVPMFEGDYPRTQLHLLGSTPLKDGVIGLHYVTK